jgi:hypothetical protein
VTIHPIERIMLKINKNVLDRFFEAKKLRTRTIFRLFSTGKHGKLERVKSIFV